MTLNMEVKKHAMQQLQDGSWKLTVTIHPSDMPMELLQAPMGTPYDLAMIPIDYDNPAASKMESTPEKPDSSIVTKPKTNCDQSEKSEGEKLWIRAVLLCKDEEFQTFYYYTYPTALMTPRTESQCAGWIKERCNIKKRSELAHNKEAQEEFRRLDQQFKDWQFEQRHADNISRM